MLPFILLPYSFPRPSEILLKKKDTEEAVTRMESMTDRTLFLTASSSKYQKHAQSFFLPSDVKNGVGVTVGEAGTASLPAQTTVAILGTGDFSKCLSIRLLRCGFKVVVGSRHPKLAAQSFPHVVDVTHHEDAVGKASIVFLAIHREHYSILWDIKHLLEGRYQNNYTLKHRSEEKCILIYQI